MTRLISGAALCAVLFAAGCASVGPAAKPSWLTVVSATKLDGKADDLVTASGSGPSSARARRRLTPTR